jgi:hypothetical protein
VACHPAQLGPRDLTLASSGLAYGSFELEIEPRLWQLAAEDAAWSLAVADWRARRPSLAHVVRHHHWVREGVEHRTTGIRLAAAARDLGLQVPASA